MIRPLPSLVVCGVAGCGKSTLAKALATCLGWPMIEGDALHPPANISRMASGLPLRDADREPWLDSIAARLAACHPAVAACSALKRTYRDRLRQSGVALRFIYLDMAPALAAERVAGRGGHFMPASLIDSQFAALEPPGEDEGALWVPADMEPEAQLAAVCAWLEPMP